MYNHYLLLSLKCLVKTNQLKQTKMKNTLEEAVAKTVNFWIEKSFKTEINQNNGDDSKNGDMAFLLMNMVASKSRESVTEDKIKSFSIELTKLLINSDRYSRRLDVDYHPCEMLSVAAKSAGLDDGCFPCKTSTWINEDNSVSTRYQYGGELIKL